MKMLDRIKSFFVDPVRVGNDSVFSMYEEPAEIDLGALRQAVNDILIETRDPITKTLQNNDTIHVRYDYVCDTGRALSLDYSCSTGMDLPIAESRQTDWKVPKREDIFCQYCGQVQPLILKECPFCGGPPVSDKEYKRNKKNVEFATVYH